MKKKNIKDLKNIGKMCAMVHLKAYEEYGLENLRTLIEYGDFESEENKKRYKAIEDKGYREIDANMFGIMGHPECTGQVVVFLKNEIPLKKDEETK